MCVLTEVGAAPVQLHSHEQFVINHYLTHLTTHGPTVAPHQKVKVSV